MKNQLLFQGGLLLCLFRSFRFEHQLFCLKQCPLGDLRFLKLLVQFRHATVGLCDRTLLCLQSRLRLTNLGFKYRQVTLHKLFGSILQLGELLFRSLLICVMFQSLLPRFNGPYQELQSLGLRLPRRD